MQKKKRYLKDLSRTVRVVFRTSLCVETTEIVFHQVASVRSIRSTKPNVAASSAAWQRRHGYAGDATHAAQESYLQGCALLLQALSFSHLQ